MQESHSYEPDSSSVDGLDDHLEMFSEALEIAGYAGNSTQQMRHLVVQFLGWMRDVQVAISHLDEALLWTYLTRRGEQPRAHERAALRRFLDYLRDVGIVPPPAVPGPSSADLLIAGYRDHLEHARGLTVRSVEIYSPLARAFAEAHQLPDNVASLDASAIRGYLLEWARGRSVSYTKLQAAVLRSFLRFLFLDGVMGADLSIALPQVRRWQRSAPPPYLAPDEVERVLASTDRSTVRGSRAFAILLLLARLGLRAGEIVALNLDDLLWGKGEILVLGKGRIQDRLPLLEDVGEALASYIRDDRGHSTSRRVFLRLYAPRVGLSNPTAVCVVAREGLRRANLRPVGRVGAHIFRHSLATRMIWHGALLSEISQVLRHRSLGTTQLYARVELGALRGVARPWPSAEDRR